MSNRGPAILAHEPLRPGAVTHGWNQSQRLLECSVGRTATVVQVQAPPNGNVAPPGY
jgi:hypothetical protein